jgi:hypothetical protein
MIEGYLDKAKEIVCIDYSVLGKHTLTLEESLLSNLTVNV